MAAFTLLRRKGFAGRNGHACTCPVGHRLGR